MLTIIFVLSLFAGRLVQLQGMESGNYRKLALQEREKPITLPALRGSITGANGQVLAMTVATYQVTADPPQIPVAQQQHVADALAGPLGMTPDAVLGLIQHPTSPQYVVLAKGVSASGQRPDHGDESARHPPDRQLREVLPRGRRRGQHHRLHRQQ